MLSTTSTTETNNFGCSAIALCIIELYVASLCGIGWKETCGIVKLVWEWVFCIKKKLGYTLLIVISK